MIQRSLPVKSLNSDSPEWGRLLIAASLIGLAVSSRLIPHPPNFSPLAAIALFSGATIANRYWAFAVPMLALVLSDAVLGLYPDWPIVYLAFALTVAMGRCAFRVAKWTTV